MKVIQFKELQSDGTTKVVAVAKLVDDKVKIVCSDKALKKSLSGKVADPAGGPPLTMKNTVDWLEALPYNYAGSYFFAEKVEV